MCSMHLGPHIFCAADDGYVDVEAQEGVRKAGQPMPQLHTCVIGLRPLAQQVSTVACCLQQRGVANDYPGTASPSFYAAAQGQQSSFLQRCCY